MINEEEFNAFCSNQEKELDHVIKRHTAFITELEQVIMTQYLAYFPALKEYKLQFKNMLVDDLHNHILTINETLEFLLYMHTDIDHEDPNQYNIPVMHQFENQEQELEFELNQTAPPYSHEFIEDMKMCINNDWVKAEFKFMLYKKAMEIVFKHFPEIAELSGNSIRNINFTVYVFMRDFAESFYYVTNGYRTNH